MYRGLEELFSLYILDYFLAHSIEFEASYAPSRSGSMEKWANNVNKKFDQVLFLKFARAETRKCGR